MLASNPGLRYRDNLKESLFVRDPPDPPLDRIATGQPAFAASGQPQPFQRA